MKREPVTHKNDLRFYRTLNELSMTKLAKLLGKDAETLTLIEQGQRSPTLETAWKIADFFGIPMMELFFREGDEIPARTIVKTKRGESLRSSIELISSEKTVL